MKSVLMLLLFGLIENSVATGPLATKLSVSRGSTQANLVLYYTASVQPEVKWKFGMADITSGTSNDFNPRLGRGVSRLSVDLYTSRHISVAMYASGGDTTWTYSPEFSEDDAEFDLPEVNVWSSLGNNWVYDSGVLFNASVRCTKSNGRYFNPRVTWFFLGTDPSRNVPQVELASQHDPTGQAYVSDVRIARMDSYVEGSAEANLTRQQGIVGVNVDYTSVMYPMISVEKLFTIHERGQSGAFPANFIGVYTPYSFVGRTGVSCAVGRPCSALCVGIGYNIASLELHKAGSDTLISASSRSSSTGFSHAVFDVTPQDSDDFGSYICQATNTNGNTAETVITVRREEDDRSPPLP